MRFAIDVISLGAVRSVRIVSALGVFGNTVDLTARIRHRLEKLLIRHEELAIKLAQGLSTYRCFVLLFDQGDWNLLSLSEMGGSLVIGRHDELFKVVFRLGIFHRRAILLLPFRQRTFSLGILLLNALFQDDLLRDHRL